MSTLLAINCSIKIKDKHITCRFKSNICYVNRLSALKYVHKREKEVREGSNFGTASISIFPIRQHSLYALVWKGLVCGSWVEPCVCALTRWGAHFWWDQHCPRVKTEREQCDSWKNTQQGCVWEKERVCQVVFQLDTTWLKENVYFNAWNLKYCS